MDKITSAEPTDEQLGQWLHDADCRAYGYTDSPWSSLDDDARGRRSAIARDFLDRVAINTRPVSPLLSWPLIDATESIYTLGLSDRARAALWKAGYRTVGQVAMLTEEEALAIQWFGKGALAEVQIGLARLEAANAR